jgi:hypothetical protein
MVIEKVGLSAPARRRAGQPLTWNRCDGRFQKSGLKEPEIRRSTPTSVSVARFNKSELIVVIVVGLIATLSIAYFLLPAPPIGP